MEVNEEKIKVLFSWIDFDEDLKPSKTKKFGGSHKDPRNSNIMNGPTLQLMSFEKFDYVNLFYIQEDEQSKNNSDRS